MSEPDESGRIAYSYLFVFQDGSRKQFQVELVHDTLEMVPPECDSYPLWVNLEYRQCPNCPLDHTTHPHCPIAHNLVEVVEFLKDRLSYEPVEVRVKFHDREYRKRTSLQQAASSLIGIFNVTSGCPILNKLRPMVDTHLPFMTPDESTYRTMAMYLMAQYFRHKNGQETDWSLSDLVDSLEAARETNTAFCRRLQALGVRDAGLNALSNLNAMGEITSFSIETRDLRRLEGIFLEHYGEE